MNRGKSRTRFCRTTSASRDILGVESRILGNIDRSRMITAQRAFVNSKSRCGGRGEEGGDETVVYGGNGGGRR